MKNILLCIAALALIFPALAKDKDSAEVALEKYLTFRDSVTTALHFQTGQVKLANGVAELNVPRGFKYLNEEQSKYVVEKLWGNLPQKNITGMLFPADKGPFDDSSYAFIISYEDVGFVKDDDAGKINYDELLTDMKKDEQEENKQRIAQGSSALYTVGWAQKPYYDKTNKVLHWAFNLKEDGATENTLNYKVILLGRKGILTMNAVAGLSQLDSVKAHIDEVLAIPKFADGNAYKDFNPNVDRIAAWTIGGLVAGKILAHVGIFAIIAKFLAASWKFILLGLAAVGGSIKKFFGRRKRNDDTEELPEETTTTSTQDEIPAS